MRIHSTPLTLKHTFHRVAVRERGRKNSFVSFLNCFLLWSFLSLWIPFYFRFVWSFMGWWWWDVRVMAWQGMAMASFLLDKINLWVWACTSINAQVVIFPVSWIPCGTLDDVCRWGGLQYQWAWNTWTWLFYLHLPFLFIYILSNIYFRNSFLYKKNSVNLCIDVTFWKKQRGKKYLEFIEKMDGYSSYCEDGKMHAAFCLSSLHNLFSPNDATRKAGKTRSEFKANLGLVFEWNEGAFFLYILFCLPKVEKIQKSLTQPQPQFHNTNSIIYRYPTS